MCVVPLSAMFYSITPVSLAIPDGSELHDAAVTAIYAIQSQQEGDDLLLLGFSDGRVIAASYPGFDSTAVFQGHVEPVVSFFRPPKQVLPRYSTLACSIAEDNSIVLMDLEDPRILLTFSGHEAPIASVAFRPEDGFMCVKTTDHFLYVWSLKSGHLDRIEAGEAAEDILATCDPKSRVATEFDTGGLDYPAEATIAAVPVQCGRPGEGIAMLLLSANVKKLGLDSQRRKRTFPSRPSSINSLIKDRAIESPEIQSYRGASPLPSAPGTPPPATGRQSLAVPDVEVQGRLSPGRTATPSDFGDAEGDSIDETFVHATLSASMSWELEPKMDKLYRDRLGLAKPADRLSLATKGPGGFWSCIAPDTVHGKQEWRLSPHLTASRILNALALSRSLLAADGELLSLSCYR